MWKNVFCVLGTYMRYPFWYSRIPERIPWKPFCDQWRIFNAFVSTCEFSFRATHGYNRTCRFYTEDFITFASFCGVVGLLSLIIKLLIGRIGSMWSVMYINAKCIYLSETCVCTIIECAIVWHSNCVTSTWPFNSWWSSASNSTLTQFT